MPVCHLHRVVQDGTDRVLLPGASSASIAVEDLTHTEDTTSSLQERREEAGVNVLSGIDTQAIDYRAPLV